MATFRFRPLEPFAYRAGQHLRLTVPHVAPDERGITRYFTIASAPAEPFVAVTTRLSEPTSSFKRALVTLPLGSAVEASGPGGRFIYPDDGPPAVFIAGGIGITPFRSILVDLAQRSAAADVVLLYANRGPDLPFGEELDELACLRPDLRLVMTLTRPTPRWSGEVGRIDASFIARHVPDLERRLAFVAGPRPMVESTVDALEALGMEPARVHQELFPGYEL